jgi:hypothetical protein
MKSRLLVVVLIGTALSGCAMHQKPPLAATARAPGPDDRAGAVAANILYVPGHGLVCGGSAVLSGVAMLITFGHAYEAASQLMHGGCSGPWVLRASDIRQAVQ